MVHLFMFKRIALSLCFTLFLGLLSSCSPKGILHINKSESSKQKATSEPPKNAKSDPQISQPVALPPRFNDTPLEPGKSTAQYMPNGLPALKPKGINVDTLFAENIKDSGKRFKRVENAVVDLRKEVNSYRPAIVRLSAVEADIQNLIKELEVLLQETPNQQPVPLDIVGQSADAHLQVEQLKPQPPPPDSIPQITMAEVKKQPPAKIENKKPPEKPKPPVKTYSDLVAQNLRVGEHADKVRLVLDTNKSTSFNIDLDNEEKLIIIEMPDARWVGAKEKSFKGGKLIESYSVESLSNGTGSLIAISLAKGTKILQEKRLSPDATSPYHRIYFDLKL